MIYLTDANILSEAMRPNPRAIVTEWLRANERELAVDPIILGEIRFGIYRLAPGARRRRLEHWFLHGVQTIRCLAWDGPTGLRWAKLVSDLKDQGMAMSVKDSLIAATALTHNLTVATHNTKDFAHAGVKLIDPYDE